MQKQTRQLILKLPPKQKSLDFETANLWNKIPRRDQDACRVALSRLLFRVIQSKQKDEDHE
jgi:hypothetical protein